MKPWFTAGLLSLAVALVGASGEEVFSKAIRPEDFRAAELDKLSPAALAHLDQLVQAYKSGAVASARAEAEAHAAVVAAREKEKQKAESPGFFARAKVLLAPGTKVEYSELQSRMVGDFNGWEGRKIFTLENGQRWKVANGGVFYTSVVHNPKVRIYPAALGGFWMSIEGMNSPVRVVLVE